MTIYAAETKEENDVLDRKKPDIFLIIAQLKIERVPFNKP